MRSLVVAATLLVACAQPASAPTTTSTPRTEVTATATTAASPTSSAALATPVPTASAPAGSFRYVSGELGYSLDLPVGWRRASCSLGVTGIAPLKAVEIFVGLAESEERIGPGTRLVMVQVNELQGGTATQYLESDVQLPDVRVEAVTLNGRQAARALVVTTGVTYAFAVAARGWMYHVERPYFGSEDAELLSIMSTLRILDEAAGPQSASPTPRTVEMLADAIAASFAKKDLTAIADTLEPCVSVVAVPGDGGQVSRAAFLNDLASQFAAGVSVLVRARPIEVAPFGPVVQSTWLTPGQPDRRVDFALRARGERWSIATVLYRAP